MQVWMSHFKSMYKADLEFYESYHTTMRSLDRILFQKYFLDENIFWIDSFV